MKVERVHIKSFGCQMNKLDTSLIRCCLKEAGFVIVESENDADIVVINTCSVRSRAEEKVYSYLGKLKHLKKDRAELVVCLAGCMAQRLGEELVKEKTVDLVCGPGQIPQIVELIQKAKTEKKKIVAVTKRIRKTNPENPELEKFESFYDSDDKQLPAQAFVRVMRGCNKFCSYCVVPYVRGPEISRPPQAVIEQIKKLADQGVKLITLLGQSVNSYEYRAGEKTYCLADLLEAASAVEGIQWLRFVTSYPTEKYFEQICRAMAALPKVCNYLHLPAQSGSDRILKAMNRNYSSAQYMGLVDKARDIVGDIAVSGDFIVGFPGETDEDFEQTVDLTEKAKYKNAFVFKYSQRPATTAEKKLEDNVPDKIKTERNIRLLAVQEKISEALNAKFSDSIVQVLVEGLSRKPHLNRSENLDNPQLIARTATDNIVVFNAPENLAGQFVKVHITRTSPLTLFGQLA